jgi:hypothetical protein
MIEGTRPFRGKNFVNASTTAVPDMALAAADTPSDAANLDIAVEGNGSAVATGQIDRRQWFSSLVPALGAGLVEILRSSNNLKRDLREAAGKESE